MPKETKKFKKDAPEGGKPKGRMMDDFVRIGGFGIGSDSMREQFEYNEAGAGVDETLREVGNDPNEGIGLPQKPGADTE